MNFKKYISLAGLLFPLGLTAQTESGNIICDFETDKGYTWVGVYDTWADSPFRTGEMKGNVQICKNPLTEVDSILGFAPNSSPRCWGRSVRNMAATPSVHWWDWKNPLPCRWVKSMYT